MSTDDLLHQEGHFSFGKNWLDYAKKIDDEKIAQATDDLRRLSGEQDLEGKSFLDIGCGSGLHALAALRLGVSLVQGVDIDPDSVSAARGTLARFAPSASSSFEVCSVFDMTLDEHGAFDIVYSWGVLHHTGDMTRAIACAAELVKPGGELYLALYRKTSFCGMWRIIKRWYSKSGPKGQKRAMGVYIFLTRLNQWIRGAGFNTYVKDYGKRRGMNFYNDAHDWLGGYPYETISPDECRAMMTSLGFRVEREFTQRNAGFLSGLMGSGCDEYVFRRSD